MDPDRRALFASTLPPHLVAVLRVLAVAAVEVADGQVLDPYAVRGDRDPVAGVVAAVDDNAVAVDAPQMQPRRRDPDRPDVHAAVDQDPVARMRGIDRGP